MKIIEKVPIKSIKFSKEKKLFLYHVWQKRLQTELVSLHNDVCPAYKY